jgi:hypothetical protein
MAFLHKKLSMQTATNQQLALIAEAVEAATMLVIQAKK